MRADGQTSRQAVDNISSVSPKATRAPPAAGFAGDIPGSEPGTMCRCGSLVMQLLCASIPVCWKSLNSPPSDGHHL